MWREMDLKKQLELEVLLLTCQTQYWANWNTGSSKVIHFLGRLSVFPHITALPEDEQ